MRRHEQPKLTGPDHRDRSVQVRLDEGEMAVDSREINPWRRQGWRPLVAAHRGQSAQVPENTLDSFARAIELGAEMIECDVQLSNDGRLVMMHGTLEQSTNGSGHARDFSWDELQRLDAGGFFGPEFAGLRIPSLESVLELASDKGVPVCVDIKAATATDAIDTVRAVAELVGSRAVEDRTVLNSFHYDALRAARRVLPGIVVVPDVTPEVSEDPIAAVQLARSLEALITMHHHDIPTATVSALHDAGVAVWVWGVTDEASIARSVSQGVDAILSQDVAAVVEVLDRLRPLADG
jgi:glycerophosphoryl diester phosphodiesterase